MKAKETQKAKDAARVAAERESQHNARFAIEIRIMCRDAGATKGSQAPIPTTPGKILLLMNKAFCSLHPVTRPCSRYTDIQKKVSYTSLAGKPSSQAGPQDLG
jgi:hypothetical protein